MASSGYTAITFVADELLTSTKMNQMAANDASFNNGNGFEDAIIKTRHLGSVANLQIPQANLTTTLLGFQDTGTTQGSIGASEVDLTSLAVTVTVPSGGRNIRISASTWLSSNASGDTSRVFIKEGSTYLGFHTLAHPNVFGYNAFWSVIVQAPSAGSHTYKLSCYRQSGSGTMASNAGTISALNTKPFIMVELM